MTKQSPEVALLPAYRRQALAMTASITNNQPWMLFPRPVLLEWDTTPNPMAKDLVKEPLVPTNGLLQVPDGIGIGVEVNEEAIKNYLLE